MSDPDGTQASSRRLQVFGIWAEIVSAAAVVVSLVFVGLQVRQTAEETSLNTEITRAAAYDRSMEGLNRWRLTLAADPELVRLWAQHIQGQLEFREQARDPRLQLLLNTLWGVYENSYIANQYGLLGASEWGRFQRQICMRYRSSSEFWNQVPEGTVLTPVRGLLTEEFATYVESSC